MTKNTWKISRKVRGATTRSIRKWQKIAPSSNRKFCKPFSYLPWSTLRNPWRYRCKTCWMGSKSPAKRTGPWRRRWKWRSSSWKSFGTFLTWGWWTLKEPDEWSTSSSVRCSKYIQAISCFWWTKAFRCLRDPFSFSGCESPGRSRSCNRFDIREFLKWWIKQSDTCATSRIFLTIFETLESRKSSNTWALIQSLGTCCSTSSCPR